MTTAMLEEACAGHKVPHEHSMFCLLANADPDGVVVGMPCQWQDFYWEFHAKSQCPDTKTASE